MKPRPAVKPSDTPEPVPCSFSAGTDWTTCKLPDFPAEPVAPAPPAAALIAVAAREDLPVRIPEPHTSPDADGFQLVSLDTWFYVDATAWKPVWATATAGGVSATVTATPTSMTWDSGDGTTPVECAGPGHGYIRGQKPPCGHVYTRSGSYEVTVTVTWHATWTSSTGETGFQADIDLTTTLPLTVRSAQAVTD